MIVELDTGDIGYCEAGKGMGDYVDIITEDDYGKPISIPGTIVGIIEE
jgi:hypothetical protein